MTAIDPICGMEVDTTTAQWKADYKGQTYYFCAPGCKRTFEKDPEKALKAGPSHSMMMGPSSEHKD